MDPNQFDLAAWQRLRGAQDAGSLSLVDEDGQPLQLDATRYERCWAHLEAADEKRTYVQELPTGSVELLKPRYLELLGIEV